MSKFDALGIYLTKQTASVLVLSFSEIEKIIGMELCKSAYTYDAYWRPSKTHVLPNLIQDYGYQVDNVDLGGKKVTLCKQ